MLSGFKGCHHWIIATNDVDECIRFYTEHFGWESLFDQRMEGPEFEQTIGIEGAHGRTAGGRIGRDLVEFVHLSWSTAETIEEGRIGIRSFGIEVADAEQTHRECVAKGIEVSGPPNEIEGCKIFFLTGPDGQEIEVVEFLTDQSWGGVRL